MIASRWTRRAVLLASAAISSGAGPAWAAGPVCPTADCDPSILVRRSLAATVVRGDPPVLDGRLDDAAWADAPVATGFVEARPRPAAPASLRSEARVLADGDALYVGLRYYDPEPARIQGPLLRRDDESTSDWAFVEIDSRYDRHTGFSFGVNPRGVQVDGLWLSDTQYDASWNAVWQSGARIDDEGWTAEFRIPFSQIAFSLPSGARELTWGINFYRYCPSRGESSNWSPRYSGLGGVVSNFNDLHLPAPSRVRRLEAAPYVAPQTASGPGMEGRDTSVKAGGDVKVGLGSNFSLSATILPDFGQVEADPSQVNLTAFELFQAERRPFFLEGLEVFRLNTSLPFSTRGLSFADDAPFYSRRVGGVPGGTTPADSRRLSFPAATTILGAAKLSGQTAGGWTLGVFTAFTDRERAEVVRPDGERQEWPVETRAATTVARALKTLNGGDSSFGLFGAHLHRFAMPEELADGAVRDSVLVGTEGQHRFGGRRYEVRAWALLSRLSGDPEAITRVGEAPHHYFQRPDAPPRERGADRLDGFAAEARLSKIGGAFRWDLVSRAMSPGFDMNATGFERTSDWLLVAGIWRYEEFHPSSPVRTWAIGSSNLGMGWTWDGEPRARVADLYGSLDTRDFWKLKLGVTRELTSLSTDWLRGGPGLLLPPRTSVALSVLTDQRKPTFGSLDVTARREAASGSQGLTVAPAANVRSSDRLLWSVGATWQTDTIGWQFVDSVEAPGDPVHVVGRVRQSTLSLTLRADYSFSPQLVLQAYLQPFATLGRYDAFQRLAAPRAPSPRDRFTPLRPGDVAFTPPDAEERAVNGSAVLRWEYRPGSFLTAAWTHSRRSEATLGQGGAARALFRAFGDAQVNAFLVKISLRLGS